MYRSKIYKESLLFIFRGRIKSEVQNLMSKEDVVILDFSNYIKGFRYELYCISKLYQTPQCVVGFLIVKSFKS